MKPLLVGWAKPAIEISTRIRGMKELAKLPAIVHDQVEYFRRANQDWIRRRLRMIKMIREIRTAARRTFCCLRTCCAMSKSVVRDLILKMDGWSFTANLEEERTG